MATYTNPNITQGIKVSSKFNALFLKEIWNRFPLVNRNFLSSIRNYYQVNGFLTNKQYFCLVNMYNKYIENNSTVYYTATA